MWPLTAAESHRTVIIKTPHRAKNASERPAPWARYFVAANDRLRAVLAACWLILDELMRLLPLILAPSMLLEDYPSVPRPQDVLRVSFAVCHKCHDLLRISIVLPILRCTVLDLSYFAFKVSLEIHIAGKLHRGSYIYAEILPGFGWTYPKKQKSSSLCHWEARTDRLSTDFFSPLILALSTQA